MKCFALVASIIMITSIPVVSVAENTYPPWFFTDASLNYTGYYYMNSTLNMIFNFSYKITYTINGHFNYTYYMKYGKNVTTMNSNGTAADPNGFPALNTTDLNMLNMGNASFMMPKISIPGIYHIKVLKNITVATFSGNVISDEVILVNEAFDGALKKAIYENYSQYSGVLLNKKDLNFINNKSTETYFMITYTNIPLSKVTLTQVFLEFIIAILFVIALLYFFKRYRRVYK